MEKLVALAVATLALVGCTTIRPGEVGVRKTFGHLAQTHRDNGLVLHSPIGVSFERVNVQTQNLEMDIALPSQEGVNVKATVSVLYRALPEKAPQLIAEVGSDFDSQLVTPVFRSASADVSAKFLAKDMHSGQRGVIEAAIAERMNETLRPRGIEVEAVLMKSISLPAGLYSAIEAKLAAEQGAQRMQFLLVQERQEAERRRIEAEGVRDAQRILEEGLSPAILSWRSIEAFEKLAESPNAKTIITSGEVPMLIPDVGTTTASDTRRPGATPIGTQPMLTELAERP
jgi:regulator of protease activity HflC (stomatin/prohibitin superfamily)